MNKGGIIKLNESIEKIYVFCDWIMKLAYLNVLWIIFSLMGMVVFGMAPATVSVFVLIRKWLQKESVPIFKTFYFNYKKEFLQSNKLFLLFILPAIALYLDFKLLLVSSLLAQILLFLPLLLVSISMMITVLYIFPVYVHYQLKTLEYVKQAFIIALLNIHHTVLFILAIALLSFMFTLFPGVFVFLGIPIIATMLMWGATKSFLRVERKQKTLINNI